MLLLVGKILKKINYIFYKIKIVMLQVCHQAYHHIYHQVYNLSINDLHNDLTCKRIFSKNKLDISLDNPYSPEEGRDLLSIYFRINKAFSNVQNAVILARSSSLNGYLAPIIKCLGLKAVSICNSFSSFLLALPKSSVIYSLDPGFSIFLFRDIAYLKKLRSSCKDEVVIAIKVHITSKKFDQTIVDNYIYKNFSKHKFYTEREDIYYTDTYIRWVLHDTGFFEVLGPFTSMGENYYIKSRLVEEHGRFKIISYKSIHPSFKGLAIYRASVKTFVNYLESL